MDEGPRFITLRGANEYVYCPRLFWLEWVASEWEHNHHTLEGSDTHRAVDKPGGQLPAPLDGDDSWHSRSLWLCDDILGISGIIDVVDVIDCDAERKIVMPVDTKKGRPTKDGLMWDSDRIQITLQALLLKNHGYEVNSIAAYYATTRRRVIEELSDETIMEALDAVEGARGLLEEKDAPLPLIDSPKCPGCSLNAICMPDELNALDGLCDSPRQVLVPKDDSHPVYISLAGAKVRLTKRELLIDPPSYSDEKKKKISIEKISELNLLGGVQITTQALQACLRRDVPIRFFSYGGWYYGRASGFSSKNVAVRIAQFEKVNSNSTLDIACVLIADKIHNSRVLILRNAKEEDKVLSTLKRCRNTASKRDDVSKLLGTEGEAAKAYWSAFSKLCSNHNGAFEMKGRNRRPPRDRTNALLSFAYALLVKDCVRAVEAAGLDPYLGIYHTAHHGRPSLALDLMEPFRPLLADSVVLQLIKRNEVKGNDFIITGGKVMMKKQAKKGLIGAYERRMQEEITHPVFGYKASYRRTLAIQARLLARALTGEIDAFPSFRTR